MLCRYLVTNNCSFTGHEMRLLNFLLCWLEMWLLPTQRIWEGDELLRINGINSLCSLNCCSGKRVKILGGTAIELLNDESDVHNDHKTKELAAENWNKHRDNIWPTRILPSFRFVPLSGVFEVSRREVLPIFLSPSTLTTFLIWEGLDWALELFEAFAPFPANALFWEVFGTTAGITSSGFDTGWGLLPSFTVCSTFTLTALLLRESLDDTALLWRRSRANLDSVSCNLFCASSSCRQLGD